MKVIMDMAVDEVARVSRAQDPTGETVRLKLRARSGVQTMNIYLHRDEVANLALGQVVMVTVESQQHVDRTPLPKEHIREADHGSV